MDHRSEKRVGRLMKKKMFVLWRRIVETKNPVIIKKKTTSTSKNKTKMTTKNNINEQVQPSPQPLQRSSSQNYYIVTLTQAFLDPPTTRHES